MKQKTNDILTNTRQTLLPKNLSRMMERYHEDNGWVMVVTPSLHPPLQVRGTSHLCTRHPVDPSASNKTGFFFLLF